MTIAALALLHVGCGDSKSSGTTHAGGAGGAGGAAAGANPSTGGAGAAAVTSGGGSGAPVIFGTGGNDAGGGAAGAIGQGGAAIGGESAVAGSGATGGAFPVVTYNIVGCTTGAGGTGGLGGAAGASASAGGTSGASAGTGGASGGTAGASAGTGGTGGASGGHDGTAGAAGKGGGSAFASFSVYDWMTDKPVQSCIDETRDFNITVSGEAPLTVVANFAPGSGPGSVVFTYDGVDQPIQDLFPYALAPDNNGDFTGPTPALAPGKHTLAIAAYDQAGALGKLLGQISIALTVISTGP